MHILLLFCTYNSELKPILGRRLYTHFLWTMHMLQRREWANNCFRALRERNLETAFHLCVERPVTRTIWEAIGIAIVSSQVPTHALLAGSALS